MTARWTVVAILCLTPILPSRAVAQREDVELEARTDFAAARYKEALEIYAGLYARTQHPTYMRNIARCYQMLGQPDEAIDRFHEYLRKAGPLDAKARQEIEGFISEMQALKQSRESRREAPRPPAPRLEAPRHVEAADAAPPTLLRSTAPRDTNRDTNEERVADAPFYARWYFWTAVATVAAGGIVTALVLSSSSGPQAPSAMTALGTKDATRP